jgi:hypothetical protein
MDQKLSDKQVLEYRKAFMIIRGEMTHKGYRGEKDYLRWRAAFRAVQAKICEFHDLLSPEIRRAGYIKFSEIQDNVSPDAIYLQMKKMGADELINFLENFGVFSGNGGHFLSPLVDFYGTAHGFTIC